MILSSWKKINTQTLTLSFIQNRDYQQPKLISDNESISNSNDWHEEEMKFVFFYSIHKSPCNRMSTCLVKFLEAKKNKKTRIKQQAAVIRKCVWVPFLATLKQQKKTSIMEITNISDHCTNLKLKKKKREKKPNKKRNKTLELFSFQYSRAANNKWMNAILTWLLLLTHFLCCYFGQRQQEKTQQKYIFPLRCFWIGFISFHGNGYFVRNILPKNSAIEFKSTKSKCFFFFFLFVDFSIRSSQLHFVVFSCVCSVCQVQVNFLLLFVCLRWELFADIFKWILIVTVI